MNKHLLAAGIAAAALIPSFAFAQQPCEPRQDNRLAGTVVGAGLGAVIGGAVAGRDDRTKGAVIGGLGGAIIGNQVAKPDRGCERAYGYYDRSGLWHATAVEPSQAQGYYDRDGAWVTGAPNGYYDREGRWIAARSVTEAAGYRDARGAWVPASAPGYYDAEGRWVAGAASGYYDRSGRWVAGPAVGRYDARGRWIAGQPAGHRDASGAWIAEAQPGYYDANGRWRAGRAEGYYDAHGRWIATAPAALGHATDSTYQDRPGRTGAPTDLRSRQSWLEQRIRDDLAERTLTRRQADDALRSLDSIRRQETLLRRNDGRLSAGEEASLQARLDTLNDSVARSARQRTRRY